MSFVPLFECGAWSQHHLLIAAEIPENIRLTSSLLAELIVTCLKELSEPLVTSKLSGDLLTHLRAASEGHVKLYVVKCLLEELPDQQHGTTSYAVFYLSYTCLVMEVQMQKCTTDSSAGCDNACL